MKPFSFRKRKSRSSKLPEGSLVGREKKKGVNIIRKGNEGDRERNLGFSSHKGVTLSAWIWIVGGVIVASIMIVLFVNLMLRFNDDNQKIFSIQSYNNLLDRATLVCSQSTGNVDYYRVAFPEVVKAVYTAKFINELPPDKVAKNIEDLDTARGHFICIQFFDESSARCTDVFNCNVTMTYMGTPATKSDLASFIAKLQGKYAIHNYLLTLNKTETKSVDILGERELRI